MLFWGPGMKRVLTRRWCQWANNPRGARAIGPRWGSDGLPDARVASAYEWHDPYLKLSVTTGRFTRALDADASPVLFLQDLRSMGLNANTAATLMRVYSQTNWTRPEDNATINNLLDAAFAEAQREAMETMP